MSGVSKRSFLKVICMATAAHLVAAQVSAADEKWPDLPIGIKNGIGVQIGDRIYVGLGSAGGEFYALDTAHPAEGWQRKSSFIGPATNGAAAAVIGSKIYVFSGNGKPSAEAKSPIIFNDVYAYDVGDDSWEKLDTKTPVGLSGARAVDAGDGKIAIVGGYNKKLFDKYLADVSALDKDREPEKYDNLVRGYMGMKPAEYFWNQKILSFDPSALGWDEYGENPFPANCDPALARDGSNSFVVVSGEIKPGLRTPATKRLTFDSGKAALTRIADLPKPIADEQQEGVAGAYAARAGSKILVAGGANFKGAQANAAAGRWYAHEGLKKEWRDEIYALDGAEWKEVGRLPVGSAYGASFAVDGGMLVVGGEDKDGAARKDVYQVRLTGDGVTIEQ